MEQLKKDFADIAEFRLVYIREAHPIDSKRPAPYADDKWINQATTFGERCAVAFDLLDDKKLSISTIVDDMDNSVNEAYSAFPDRIFVVDVDGKIAIAADRGPWGFEPAIKDVRNWLDERRVATQKPATKE